MSLETTGLLYTGPNQTGQSQLIGMSLGDRYNHANGADLQRAGFYNNVQSGRLYDSSRVDVSITLLWDDSFHDAFVQMTAARGNGYIDFWVTGGPRSWLLTASSPGGDKEVRLSYRDMFADKWKTMIDDKIRGSGRRDVEPVLDWEMFPTDPRYTALDSSLCYLKVHQDLMVFVPWPFTDYHVWMEYWIYLFPSGAGVRASVPQWGAYVEGGAIHDKVWDKFVPIVRDGAPTLQDTLNQTLAGFDGLAPNGVHDVYYMPGRQLTAPSADVHGKTKDDTTIVVAIN